MFLTETKCKICFICMCKIQSNVMKNVHFFVIKSKAYSRFWRCFGCFKQFLDKAKKTHKKSHFAELAEILCVDSQAPPRSGRKSWQTAISGSKNVVKGRGGVESLIEFHLKN